MLLDVTDLRDFYASPMGQVVRRLIVGRVRARWRALGGRTLIGLGFATPFIATFRGEAAHIGALMPAGQGVSIWPHEGPVLSALVEEDRLPLADNSVDFLLLAHALEVAARPSTLLRELWRVLAPEGRLLVIAPNRRGVWARLDNNPFGHGQPYSRGQLERLLTGSLFTLLDISGALYVPPLDKRLVLRSAPAMERIGAGLGPTFAGVLIVEARKETVAPVGGRAAARSLGEVVAVGVGRRD